MGTYKAGVLGNFNGKIGTVIGARWKGIDYMRHKGQKSNKPATFLQLDHQAKFSLVTRFVHKIGKLLMDCYPGTPQLTGINNAFKEIYGKAIMGVYPSYALDYSKVLVSKGELHNANSPTAQANGNGSVKFNWIDNTDNNMANADDKAVLLVYCPEFNQCLFTKTGAERQAGTDSLNVINFTGKLVETWVSFRSANGKDTATSIYTGQFIVS